MEIENNLIGIFNAMCKNTNTWKYVTSKQKEEFFFIFNRYFSKKYPDKAQLLNTKSIDKVMAMELWYHFIKDEPYPRWFWSKGEKSEKAEIAPKDYKSLLRLLLIKNEDLDYLIKNHSDFIKEELKYLKKLNTL